MYIDKMYYFFVPNVQCLECAKNTESHLVQIMEIGSMP